MASNRVVNARTYALVGFFFYLIGLIALMFGMSVLLFFDATSYVDYYAFPIFNVTVVVVFFIMLGIWIGLSTWAWSTVRQIEGGMYREASTSSLVLGVLGLFFGLLIGGIFFLLTYSELGTLMMNTPASRLCIHCGRPVPPDARFCPSCGKELTP